jgi:tetratricopeptide (TPR) repeat protein
VRLTNFKHDYQGWNNCGPTTLGMLLSHFGFGDTQKEIAPVVKPNPNDKNVNPEELAAYARSKQNLQALVRVNGSMQLLKVLLANGLPVIVETWFTPKPNDGMGHYRLLYAYNDAQQKFYLLDSYLGPNVTVNYDEFDADWKVFNRLYLVTYQPGQSALLNAIIGPSRDDQAMWARAKTRAESEVAANGNDAFAWYNLGASLGALGDHGEAAKAFDRARRIGLPWRMLWYQFQIFDTYLALGRFKDVLDLTDANLRQAGDLEESFYYRGRALQALGKTTDAIAAYREALRLNKNYTAAAKALERLG